MINDNDDESEIWWVVKWMKDDGHGNVNENDEDYENEHENVKEKEWWMMMKFKKRLVDRIGERRGSNGVSLGTDQPRGTSALKAEENRHNTAQIHHIGRAGRALHPAK